MSLAHHVVLRFLCIHVNVSLAGILILFPISFFFSQQIQVAFNRFSPFIFFYKFSFLYHFLTSGHIIFVFHAHNTTHSHSMQTRTHIHAHVVRVQYFGCKFLLRTYSKYAAAMHRHNQFCVYVYANEYSDMTGWWNFLVVFDDSLLLLLLLWLLLLFFFRRSKTLYGGDVT